MRNFIWLKSFLLILLCAFPLVAQTSADLRKKYQISTAVETFEVRPNIVATVSYGEGGQAISILITPRPTSDTNDQSKNSMPLKVAEELVEEFAPVSVRGKLYQNTVDLVSGRNVYRSMNYDNLTIDINLHDLDTKSPNVSQIYISWKKTAGR